MEAVIKREACNTETEQAYLYISSCITLSMYPSNLICIGTTQPLTRLVLEDPYYMEQVKTDAIKSLPLISKFSDMRWEHG